jgi:opacity protein-like surface antigen
MDKQKIRIDDLFRQQLSDREEPMPPGAWSRMSDLLDQQPSRVLASRNRGRGGILLLLTGLLALGAGGYIYQTHPSEPNAALEPQSPALSATPMASAETAVPVVSEKESINPGTSGTVAAVAQYDGPESTPKALVSPSGNTTPPAARPTALAAEIPTNRTAGRQVIPLTRQSAPASQPIPATASTAGINTTGTTVPARPESTPAIPAPVTPVPVAREAAPINPLRWIQSSVDAVFQGPVVLTMHPERVIAFLQNSLTFSGTTVSGTTAPAPATWSAKSPRSGAATTPVLASGASAIPLAVTNPTPVLSPASAIAPETTPVPTVSATQQQQGTETAALQESHLIGGVLAGINSTLSGGSGALQGIQAGIYGLLKLNERWSLGGELQYLYRLNNSMNLKDDYYTGTVRSEGVITRNGQTYYPVRYDVDSMVNRYSFGSYSSLALPLYVQYNHQRFSIYGGLNLGFHFRPNVDFADVKIATISRFDTLAAGTPMVAPASRAADVSLSDFDSRFSVGYLAGAKYQITPKLHLDLRLTQQLWDNLRQRSVGTAKVSETYLYLPTIQLSAGYRFRNHSKPKPQQP